MIELKILIKTPIGYAKSTEFKLRPFLIGRKGKLHKIMTNTTDDKILWIVAADPKRYLKIIRNVTAYKTMIGGLLKNKTVRKVARLNDQQKKDLDDMLEDQTEIDIVKEGEWEKIKKEFIEI